MPRNPACYRVEGRGSIRTYTFSVAQRHAEERADKTSKSVNIYEDGVLCMIVHPARKA
jgi:hypothetical protein